MNTREPLILALCKRDFSDLSTAESGILECSTRGMQFSPDGSPKDSPKPDVRADLIRWLLSEPKALAIVHLSGLSIRGIKVVGRINLRSIAPNRALLLSECLIPEGLDLRGTELRHLDLSGTSTGPINGDGLRITHGDLFLRLGFSTCEVVKLVGSSISGDLDCSGGTFDSPQDGALIADRCSIGGDVRLDGSFKSKGKVSFVGASITGSFICSGGSFENQDGRALSLDAAKVGAGLSLDEGFHAIGLVAFAEARITGGINFSGASLETVQAKPSSSPEEKGAAGHSNVALEASRANVLGDILFVQDFSSTGLIDLSGSCIDGSLYFSGARFESKLSNGLLARGANVKHAFRWQGVKRGSATILDLTHCTVDQLYDDRESWPVKGNLSIQDFTYRTIGEGPMEARERLRWIERQYPSEGENQTEAQSLGNPSFSLQPYEQLAGWFRRTGQEASAREISIAKEEARRERGNLSGPGYFSNRFLGLTIRHGYGVGRILAFGLAMVLLGWLTFSEGYNSGLVLRSSDPNKTLGTTNPSFSPFVYSVDTFLPIVDLHQESYWLPDADRKCILSDGTKVEGGRYLRWYLWGHIALGWIVSTLSVASLSGLIRRD
jgi:hypothetical protein